MLQKFRLTVTAALLLGLVSSTAGCGGGKTPTAPREGPGTSASAPSAQPKEPVKLVMWWWGDQEAQGAKQWVDETIQEYQKLHPEVTIEAVLQTTDGLYPAFEAAAKAKKGPDIQYLWGGINTLGMAWQGYLAPISDYIPEQEWRHYLNHHEELYDGKLWSAPWYTQPSFPIVYNKELFAKAGLDPEKPPKSWDEFVAAAEKLKAAGITPLAGGLKDGWFGGWLFSVFGAQNLDSAEDIIQAVVSGDLTDRKYSEWVYKLAETIEKGYWNPDITSLELYQGLALWTQGKAAMTWVAGSDIRKFVTQMGAERVGVMTAPVFGRGKLAGTFGSTSQTLAITSFSQHKEQAADFIRFTHEPQRMKRFYEITGSIPADDRFPVEAITLPQQKEIFRWMTQNGGAYIENFIPAKLDSEGNFAGMQLLFSGSKKPDEVVQLLQDVVKKWRDENPAEVERFKSWKPNG
ncbi:ABC transporter substrate-binding protein [Caldinitratiruptor microaerophilus]|uniref:ABC transporter extracellular-binding protein YurO n=1 Tax=Caldinitratiruptor microaerophilus TaxID=671077 RepID=A0AA35G7P4_9FIRM|nr:extracellular solute-binding protein [Caldinitratiruptor microaerophilus]BDG60125.1 putative ABC transporter extracellular-binding protein YurO [Caldinitratiruptor microaerophilus]